MDKDHKECRFKTDTVFNCVTPYIDDNDRNSVSLVSRKLHELDNMTHKHIAIHNSYAVPPSRVVERFLYLESLTVKGYPRTLMFRLDSFKWGGYVTPWVEEIVKSLKRLECVCFKRMIVHDSDLELLAERCGEKLRVLKIEACTAFSTDGLLHIGKRCSNLRTLCLEKSFLYENVGEWLHELAMRNKCIESLNYYLTPFVNYGHEDLCNTRQIRASH